MQRTLKFIPGMLIALLCFQCEDKDELLKGTCYVVSITEGTGATVFTTYDSKNRIARWTMDSVTTLYLYDEEFNRISAVVTGTDTMRLTYGPDSLLVSMITNHSSGLQTGTVFYYNSFKQLIGHDGVEDGCTDCEGTRIAYRYASNEATTPYMTVTDNEWYNMYEYGSQINPWSLIYPYNPLVRKNIITKVTSSTTNAGIPTTIERYHYEFNEYNYPVKRYHTSIPTPQTVVEYRCQ